MSRSPLILLAVLPFAVACGSEVASNPADAAADTAATDSATPTDGATQDVSASDASAPDAATEDAGFRTFRPDASSPDTAIEAPSETWTFIPFPDSACGNGSPAGIGVNLTTRSNRVLIYLQGGGACWDGLTCTLPTADNINDNYTATSFAGEIGTAGRYLMFNRTDMRNPFRDASFVYVPYCTGDIHGGDNIKTYLFGDSERTVFHVGARNMDAYLRRLARTFASADRVWLTGASAGGYGAAINWDRVQRAFPMARVDLLDDSGQPITPPVERFAQMRASWNLQFPEGCTQCGNDLAPLLNYYATRFPAPHRMGLLSYTQDRTISTYFGLTGTAFQALLTSMLTTSFDGRANFRYYVLAGNNHTMLGSLGSLTSPSGGSLLNWVTAWATDGATWENVRPQ